jgi:hypothetical protein
MKIVKKLHAFSYYSNFTFSSAISLLLKTLLQQSIRYHLEPVEEANIIPRSIPTIAPDQGLAVRPQVLPEHLPK